MKTMNLRHNRPALMALLTLLTAQGHAATTAAAPSSAGSLLQVALSLLLVLAVMVATAWAIKRFGPKNLTGNTPVRIVGGVSLGGRERVLVLEVADQWIIVGAAPGRVSALGTMPRQQITTTPDAPSANNFAAWLKQTIDKRNEPRNEPHNPQPDEKHSGQGHDK